MGQAVRAPLILLLIHTGLVFLVRAAVRASDDGAAVMLWIIFEVIDWPLSAGLFPAVNDDWPFVGGLLLVGGLQWLVIGSLLQLLVYAARSRDHGSSADGTE